MFVVLLMVTFVFCFRIKFFFLNYWSVFADLYFVEIRWCLRRSTQSTFTLFDQVTFLQTKVWESY